MYFDIIFWPFQSILKSGFGPYPFNYWHTRQLHQRLQVVFPMSLCQTPRCLFEIIEKTPLISVLLIWFENSLLDPQSAGWIELRILGDTFHSVFFCIYRSWGNRRSSMNFLIKHAQKLTNLPFEWPQVKCGEGWNEIYCKYFITRTQLDHFLHNWNQ